LTNNGKILVYHGGVVSGTVTGNQPVPSDLQISGGSISSSSYTYTSAASTTGGILTITGNGTYTVGMKSGLTTTTTDRIVVAPGVTATITFSSVSIDMSGKVNTAAFDMSGAAVTLTLTGTNVLISGNYRAGLEAQGDSTLTINAADVTHTLTATGGISGGTITINGGTITSTAISGTIAGLSGGAIVYASSIQPAIIEGVNATQAVVFNGAIGTVYGDITLQQDLTIINTETLHIPAFNTLTIPGEITLTNNGTIIVYQRGIVDGTVTGNQPVDSVLTISGEAISPSSYTYTGITATYPGGILTITEDGTYTIAMRSGVTIVEDDCIVVAPGVTADITLTDVHIEVEGYAAFDMSGATVNLTLVGTNILIGGIAGGPAGLQAPEGSTLTINAADTSHSLTARSGYALHEYYGTGAGIGGSFGNTTGGNITINNGTVIAVGGRGAGIGGAHPGAGGTVTINGGIVTATGRSGAGIGGSYTGAGGTITISGGTVTATGSDNAAGIGGGYRGAGGTVTITGGTVNAVGGNLSAGIGGGEMGAGGSVTISGGTVTATGGSRSAGIGGGEGGDGGSVTISGGVVTAIGGSASGDNAGAGIGGGGYRGDGGIVTISGGTVIATGGNGYNGGAGIGGGGYHSIGGTVMISGGMVTATGGSSSSGKGSGAGIGSGGDGLDSGTITALSGNAVVFASSIQPTITAGTNATQAIAFNGTAGTMYGNVTLQQNLTIPATHTLDLSGGTLTIGGVTLTNDGTINKNGGTIVGTPAGSGTVND
jgi:hypothetical protein